MIFSKWLLFGSTGSWSWHFNVKWALMHIEFRLPLFLCSISSPLQQGFVLRTATLPTLSSSQCVYSWIQMDASHTSRPGHNHPVMSSLHLCSSLLQTTASYNACLSVLFSPAGSILLGRWDRGFISMILHLCLSKCGRRSRPVHLAAD